MPHFTFEDFEFNTQSYSLTQKGAAVALRPKTAKLLAFFLINQGRTVSKAELITAVWGNSHAPEYALHQLVSELRKLAKEKVLVRTQPNQGYCWIASTKFVADEPQAAQTKPTAPRPLWGYAVVATLAACLVIVFGFGVLSSDNDAQESSSLPAIRALAKGIVAMEEGNQDDATAWFEFVLAENPQANEARLLLAESLLQQNRLQEASAYLYPMLAAAEAISLGASEYEKMAAAELLSRVHQRGGQYSQALDFARQSFFESRAQCTLEHLDDRLRELANLTGERNPLALPLKPELPQLDTAPIPDYNKYCQRLKSPPDQDEASINWSSPISKPQWATRSTIGPALAGRRQDVGVHS